ncbi:MAG: DUF2330 domain-containing protein [Myxococcales bacterium]|nr:DUF2330 domain-containing protein [Myxococcales bacterium]
MKTLRRTLSAALTLGLGVLALAASLRPAVAEAFCGFYVSGADSKLYNNATSVVLLRDGTRTVLSMQNNYQGPPEDFAMVVPVPTVLRRRDVKVLPRDVFDRLDAASAPRLVEYWEQDPCPEPVHGVRLAGESKYVVDGASVMSPAFGTRRGPPPSVKIEAEFAVGEYEIVILSASDSLDLERWLRANGYAIPPGAAEVLRPYVHGGMKFFVAKVNTRKVEFKDGQATLSPLRFHYDSVQFSLPVRLGLLNSSGAQDLIVYILSRAVRYQVANLPNVAIPTNLEVTEATRARFGEFYAALFDRALEPDPRAVVTEYAWTTAIGKCDPCTTSTQLEDLVTLGVDVLPTYARLLRSSIPPALEQEILGHFALTRLHARYTPDSLRDDLVFQAGVPITGGRELHDQTGAIERGASVAERNRFQARYIVRHPWTGPVTCSDPQFGAWGGPPSGALPPAPTSSAELLSAPRGAPLESFLVEAQSAGERARRDPAALPDDVAALPTPGELNRDGWLTAPSAGCASCRASERDDAGAALLVLLGLVAARGRRRVRPRAR